jgi:hypothetical protein
MNESLDVNLRNQTMKSSETVPRIILHNLLMTSKHLHSSLSNCCLLLFRINVLEHFDSDFNESKSLSQLRNPHGPLLVPRLMFLSFFKRILLPNFNEIVECKLLIVGTQQLDELFSILLTNLLSLLNILSLGPKDVRNNLRRDEISRGDYRD